MTRTDPDKSIPGEFFEYITEYLKSVDLYSSKATFRISRKENGKSHSSKKKHTKEIGSIFGGITTVLSQGLFIYLIVIGIRKTFSGAKDNITSKALQNTFDAPDNEVMVENFKFFPSIEVILAKQDKDIEA
jgi:hypothetical protein